MMGKTVSTKSTIHEPEESARARGDGERIAPINCKSKSSLKFLEIQT